MPGVPNVVMFHNHHNYDFIAHSHPDATVLLVTDGAFDITIDKTTYCMGAGQLAVIGAHQVHSARPATAAGWAMRSLHVAPDLLFGSRGGPGEAISFTKPTRSGLDRVASMFFELHACAELNIACDEQLERFQSFMRWLAANLDCFEPKVSTREEEGDAQVKRARDIIADSVFENVPIRDIAEEVGLSGYALIRRFNRNYGISPHAWRIQARARAAAELLRNRTPLVDIADSCGFADQAHMSRTFKKVYGVTPGQYGLMY